MNIFINIAYLLLVFWVAALSGVDNIYKLSSKPVWECTLVRNKKGRAIIKINYIIVFGNIFFLTLLIMSGAVAMFIQGALFGLINWSFDINLSIYMYLPENQWWIAIAYGWLIASGFYAGKAWTSYFAAQQILEYLNRTNSVYNFKGDLTIVQVLELNLQREEDWLSSRKV